MYKKIFLSFLAFALAIGMEAQTALQEITANRNLSAGNYQTYPTPTATLTAAPKGYTPFYISSYHRHGSRYLINPTHYSYPAQVLQLADKLGKLTERGKQVKDIVDAMLDMSNGRLGELTAEGARQHQGVAARMYKNFPEVFSGDASIDAKSTIIIRCILSMSNEIMTLKSLNPNLKVAMDASEHDMFFMNHSGRNWDSIYNAKMLGDVYSNFVKKHLHPERLMNVLFNDPDYVANNVDSPRLMQRLFSLAANMQSHDTNMELYSLFTDQECYELYQCTNVSWFLSDGNSALTDGWMPYLESELLRDILDKADVAIKDGKNAADMRFGHDSCVLPLVCLLELDDYGKEYNDLETLSNNWNTYEIIPMACNVQFVFYHKKGSDDTLVKVMLNEREVRLPVSTDNAPYYHWADVEKYYRAKLAKYDASPLK